MSSRSTTPSPGFRLGGPLAAGAALALLLAAAPARAAVMLDSFFQGSAANSPDLTDTPFTVGTGPDRLLLVAVSVAGDVPVTGVSYRGVSAVRFESQSTNPAGPLCRLELWRIVNPPSGFGMVQVSLSTATAFGLGVVSYSGVDQTSPTSAVFPAAGTTGPVRVTVTAPDSRPVLGMACLGGTWAMRAGPDATPGPSDVSLWDFTEHDVVGLGGQQTAQGGGTVSWNIVWPDTFAWSAAGLSITPASAPPPPPDAGPDATPDAEPDLSPPDDLFTPPDLAADLPPPPEAGVDAQEAADAGQAADGDTDAEADGGVMDAGAEDSAVTPDLSPVDGDPGGTTVRDVDLHVGCACRLGGHGRPSLLVGLALAFLIARRRR